MSNTKVDSFLAHYGIPGMKWGRRKSSDGSYKTGGRTAKGSEDYTESRDLLKKPAKTLSNAELRKLNERLQLEKSYTELVKSKSSLARITKGNKTTKDIVNVAKTMKDVYTLASPIAKAVKRSLDER